MTKIFVKPKRPGLIVIKPDGTRLKDEGEILKAEPFWQRRLDAKEVTIEVLPEVKTPVTTENPAKKGK